MKRSDHYFLLLILLVLGWNSVALGQTKGIFQHFSLRDGLQDNNTQHIRQDGNGYMWFKHDQAISRFDGYRIRTYMHNAGDSLMNLGHALLGNFFVDQLGNLWINGFQFAFQDKVLLKYNPQKDGFERFKPKTVSLLHALESDRVRPVLWLGGQAGGGLYEFNTETGETIRHINQEPDTLTKLKANEIERIADRGAYLILSTHNGLWRFDKQTKQFERPRVNSRDSSLLFNNIVYYDPTGNWIVLRQLAKVLSVDTAFSVIKQIDVPYALWASKYDFRIDDNQKFWFTTPQGLQVFDPTSGSVTLINDPTDPDAFVKTIHIDRDKNVWIGSDTGVKKYLLPGASYLKAEIGPRAMHNNGVYFLDDERVVVIGGSYNRGNPIWTGKASLSEIDIRSFQFEGQFDMKANYIKAWKGKEYIWIATWGRGVIGLPITKEGGPGGRNVRYFEHDPANPFTISTNDTWSIYEDENRALWVGTFDGLCRIDLTLPYGSEGSVRTFKSDANDPTSLSHNVVRQIIPDDSGAILVASEKGVDLYRDGKFQHLFESREATFNLFKASDGTLYVATVGGVYASTKQTGYASFVKTKVWESIDHVAEDNQKRLWLSSSRGLLLFDPGSGARHDFYNIPDLQPASMVGVSPSGMLALSSRNNIVIIDPYSVQTNRKMVLPALTSLEVNNRKAVVSGHPAAPEELIIPQSISELEELELDYLHNNFSLEFSAMEMTAPEKNLYRHQLEGYDPDWIETDARSRTATYTNLPAGTYTFRVMASNHHGVWSDQERKLKVIILPPPWRTWWAYTSYSLLALGLLLLARRNIVQRERLKSNLALEKIEREREHFELEKAKEVDKVKTSFFTNISHEFRTPLTLIKGPVDTMLERYKDDPEAVKRLKLVQRNSELLLRLINQLLDLAKLESGSLKVEPTAGDVHGYIRAIASGFESHARQKGVTLRVEVPQDPAPVMFDKDKLETILINLVNNAIKYTPSGGEVKVLATVGEVVTTAKAQGREGSLRITVSDTGIGIPKDQRDKVFERFHQVSESHKEVGTGIGLALVKELVNLMGGTITVESELGKGSTFMVVLPVEQVTLEEAEQQIDDLERPTTYHSPLTTYQDVAVRAVRNEERATSDGAEDGSPSKPQVLVVEDNSDVRAFIIDSLGEDYGYIEAENGMQGLDKATREIPDLIISDVMMPEMDGITMAGKIKEDRNTSHIPLILLTAKSTEESKLSGLSSGADDYLTKPFNKQELLLKVRNSINRQNKLKDKLRTDLLAELPKEKVLSADEQFLQKVKETIIQQMSDEQLSVESLADDIGMSRVQLYRKVSALTGMAVNELIRKLRLQRAAQLLGQKWGPVSQVAYEVGFSNLSYFSKVFKEEFGVLPSEYWDA